LAGLYFSALDAQLTPREILLFLHVYEDGRADGGGGRGAAFWKAVRERAQKLYAKVHRRKPPLAAA
jgi:hypothetical protein